LLLSLLRPLSIPDHDPRASPRYRKPGLFHNQSEGWLLSRQTTRVGSVSTWFNWTRAIHSAWTVENLQALVVVNGSVLSYCALTGPSQIFVYYLIWERPVCPRCDWPQPLTAAGA